MSRRVARRLLPFLGPLYLLAYLDRVNVGFAGLRMTADPRLSPRAYGLGVAVAGGG